MTPKLLYTEKHHLFTNMLEGLETVCEKTKTVMCLLSPFVGGNVSCIEAVSHQTSTIDFA